MEIRPLSKDIYECLKTLSEVNEGKTGRIQKMINKGIGELKEIQHHTIDFIRGNLTLYKYYFWWDLIFDYCEENRLLSSNFRSDQTISDWSYQLTNDGKRFIEKYEHRLWRLEMLAKDDYPFFASLLVWVAWWFGALWLKIFGEWILHFFK